MLQQGHLFFKQNPPVIKVIIQLLRRQGKVHIANTYVLSDHCYFSTNKRFLDDDHDDDDYGDDDDYDDDDGDDADDDDVGDDDDYYCYRCYHHDYIVFIIFCRKSDVAPLNPNRLPQRKSNWTEH